MKGLLPSSDLLLYIVRNTAVTQVMTEKKQFLHPGHNAKEGGERKQRFLSEPDLALSYRR